MKPMQRTCVMPCKAQFICYGECQDIYRIENADACGCSTCYQKEMDKGRDYSNDDPHVCESRFKRFADDPRYKRLLPKKLVKR